MKIDLNKLKNVFLFSFILLNGLSFLLVELTQQLFTGEAVIDGMVFYGYQNAFFYLNLLIIFIFLVIISNVKSFNFYLLLVLTGIYLFCYIAIQHFVSGAPFGDTPVNSIRGVGHYLNMISTILIFCMILLKKGIPFHKKG